MRGELESYEVLFIPYAPYIEPELKPWFERFLNQGGILVAEAATALYALDGSQEATIPGQGLHELFGAKAVGESPGLEAAPGRKGKLFDLKCDGAIPLALVAGDYSASLEGTTSATWVKRGEGAAVLLGEVAGERLPAILESLGWKRPLRVVEAEERGVQAFLLGDEERGKYLLIVNHSDAHHADVHVDSDRISAAADRFYDVLSLKSFRADALRGGWLKVGLDLTAGEVLLITLR